MIRNVHARQLRSFAGLLVVIGFWASATVGVAAYGSGEGHLTVLTQNMFQGTELGEVIAAKTPAEFLAAVTTDFQQVQASKIPERTAAMAALIAEAKPDLVGLQEVALWRTGLFNSPPATTVAYDMLQSLLDQLTARGLHYTAVAVTTNTDVEAPSTLGIDIRFTDRVAILARTDEDLVIGNPQHQNYLARLTVPTAVGPVVVTDGWASVDATLHGTTIRFVTTHLSGIAPPVGVAEGDELLAGPAQTSLPLVVTGDFNSSATPGGADPPTTYNNMLRGGLADVWATVQSGEPGYTCCQHVPDLLNPISTLNERIDFVFMRGRLPAEEARLVGADARDRTLSGLWPSDHAGVGAMLQLQ